MTLRIVYRDLRTLKPNSRNARLHSEAQIEKLQKLLGQFGWGNNTIGIAGDDILAGHGRIMAAGRMAEYGMPIPRNEDPWMVPTTDLSHLSREERRAYMLADNRSALDASWDDEMLRIELGELGEMEFDLGLTGFSLGEIDHIFAQPRTPRSDADEIPVPPAQEVSRAGDIWILGRHRIGCGDSTNPEAMQALMDGAEADFCFTSPPYAQQRVYEGSEINDWDGLMQGVFAALPMADHGQILVNLGMIHIKGEWVPYWDSWIAWMRATGWRRYGWYVWDQGFGLPGEHHGRFAPSHEFLFHFNREVGRLRKTKSKLESSVKTLTKGVGIRYERGQTKSKPSSPEASLQKTRDGDSVIRVTRQMGRAAQGVDHPAVFPVRLPLELIPAFTDPGQIVLDPFGGSATTLMAADQLDRVCMTMELSPRFVDMGVLRWQNVTGGTAVRASDGVAFNDAHD